MTETSLYLSRARLRARRGEALASIAPILLARKPDDAAANSHRIVWMLFQQSPDAGHAKNWRADADGQGFLWRDDGDGRYMVLSRQPPTDPHGLFEIETKAFAPELSEGDMLRIALRANPTRAVPSERGADGKCKQRGKRVDVVMHALRNVPSTDWEKKCGRAFERDELVTQTVSAWFGQQGAKFGFEPSNTSVVLASNYTQMQIARERKRDRRPAGISLVDIEAVIKITDPAAFLTRLPLGFGSAKAFGCGLMLIRRV